MADLNQQIMDLQGQVDEMARKIETLSIPETAKTKPFVDIPFDPLRKIDKASINSFSKFPLTPSSAPTNNYDVVNKKYVDDSQEATLLSPGPSVYNANAPTSYTDLDLSSVVGANNALVYLRITNNGVGSTLYFFKTNGDPDPSTTIGAGGCVICDPPGWGSIGYLLVFTDSSGIVEWKALLNNSTQIFVYAYIK